MRAYMVYWNQKRIGVWEFFLGQLSKPTRSLWHPLHAMQHPLSQAGTHTFRSPFPFLPSHRLSVRIGGCVLGKVLSSEPPW
jgi:hypothetical protein